MVFGWGHAYQSHSTPAFPNGINAVFKKEKQMEKLLGAQKMDLHPTCRTLTEN